MSDEPFYAPNRKPAPPPTRPTGELLFKFVRVSDDAPMACELRFHGESYGWEAQFLERGELLVSRGGFITRALAVQWAEEERKAIVKGYVRIVARRSSSAWMAVGR
jgi:hypothetical protein